MSAGGVSQADDATAESYVGSYISLTTKVGTRYQGIILKLDVQQSTILLQDVVQYGTEGRREDRPQVPPINMVYDSILFRGSEIQDIKVLYVPPVQSSTAVLDDPAIILSNYTHPSFTTTTQGYGGSNLVQQPGQHLNFDAHLTGSPSTLQSSPVPVTILSNLSHFPVTYVPTVSTEVASSSSRPNILAIAAANTSSLPRPPGLSFSPDAMVEYDARTILAPESYSHMSDALNTEQIHGSSSSNSGNRCHIQDQAFQGHEDHGQGRSPGYIRRGRGQGDVGRGRGREDMRQGKGQRDAGRGWGRGYTASQTGTRFTEEFDFDAMNQKFNKAEVWGQLGKNNPSEAEDRKEDERKNDESHPAHQLPDECPKLPQLPVYQKEDFFDSISCRTPEVKSDREKMKLASEQRKVNAETFGVPKPQRGHGNLGSNVAGSSQGPTRGRGRGKTDQNRTPKKPPS